MLTRVVLSLLVLSLPAIGYAQAYKCRTESGKVVITNQGCSGGARLEKITTAAPVTFERQLQAAEVNNRMFKQLDGIAQEQMASNATLQRRQAILMQQDANQRIVEQQQPTDMARADAAAKRAGCIATATSRRNSTMLAECKGISTVQAQKELDDALTDNQPPSPARAPSVIKSCNGVSCFDQYGQKYTTTAGKTVRSDGKRCYQQGKVTRCD